MSSSLTLTYFGIDVVLGSVGSSGSASAAPKPLNDDPAGVSEADAQSAEEMANSMLLDSPLPDAGEEERRCQEESLTGKPIMPSPLIVESSCLFGFFTRISSLGPQNQEDHMEKFGEALLVVGVSTSLTPSGNAPPLVERIKLALENTGLV